MTTHELANLLLQNPNCAIKMQSFDGGNDSFVDEVITHVTLVDGVVFVSPRKYEDYYEDAELIQCIHEPVPTVTGPKVLRRRK